MSEISIGLSPEVQHYLISTSLREHPAQSKLRAISDALPQASMRSSAEQIQFLGLLLKLMGARRVLEIGVFTGYGTLGFALALPPEGRVLAIDMNREWPALGQPHWREAGVAERIHLHIEAAGRALDGLLRQGAAASFDFAYIDADKTGYDAYYEQCLKLVRPGGIIALDNMLWGGRVADSGVADADTQAIRALNAKLKSDERVDISLLPVGDGLMLARRRA